LTIKAEVLSFRTPAVAAVDWGRYRLRALRALVQTGVTPAGLARADRVLRSGTQAARPGLIQRRLPNALTIMRILLVPVIGVLLIGAHGRADWPAGLLFGVTALTDQIDGVLARIWHTESVFGQVLDPLADKLLIGTAICCLIIGHRLSWLALAVPFARHVLFWMARFLSPRLGMMCPGWAGKLSAWMICTGLGFIIVTSRSPVWSVALFWVGLALAFVDAIRYVWQSVAWARPLPVTRNVSYLAQRSRTRHG